MNAGHGTLAKGHGDIGALAVLDCGVDDEMRRAIAEAEGEPVVLELGQQDVLGLDRPGFGSDV